MYSVRKVLAMCTHKLVRLRLSHRVQNFNSAVSQVAKDTELLYEVLPSVVNSLVKNQKLSEIPEMSSFLHKVYKEAFRQVKFHTINVYISDVAPRRMAVDCYQTILRGIINLLMEYNLTGGKKSRGLAVVSAYETIEKPENITPESLKKARTLAWILEMNHAYFIVVDDIMDGSSTRRGKPCWHELPDVGSRAANHAELLKFFIYESFQTHFKEAPLYNEMLDLLNETLLYSTMGQHIDYTMAHRIKSDYSLYTIQRYNSIVKYKTAYYTFKLPILLGYLLANNSDKDLHKKVEEVCLALGRLYQIQDDMLDCYGDESITGKKGTDIQEGKCTWFAVHALKLSNNVQRAFFIENYADKDPAKVQNIKNLYEELKLQKLYNREEKLLYEGIKKNANGLQSNDRKLMLQVLNMYYKRNQ